MSTPAATTRLDPLSRVLEFIEERSKHYDEDESSFDEGACHAFGLLREHIAGLLAQTRRLPMQDFVAERAIEAIRQLTDRVQALQRGEDHTESEAALLLGEVALLELTGAAQEPESLWLNAFKCGDSPEEDFLQSIGQVVVKWVREKNAGECFLVRVVAT